MIRNLIALPAVLAISACATIPTTPDSAEPVTLRIIGINDFHGNLEPLRLRTMLGGKEDYSNVPVGGAAYLASAIAKYRAQAADSMVISAGDMIGASPLISSLFLDEPAIGVMNRIGVTYNAVGNHEFDRGSQELLRIQNGGCEKFALREPCQVEASFPGANFPFLSANVVQEDGSTLFPAYGITRFGSGPNAISVGVIGLTTVETPNLVTASGVDGLTFTDEADTINALVPQLKDQGVDVIVVSIHQGLYTEVGYNDQSCSGVSGELLGILKRVDPRVDLVISGHTHRAYICYFANIDPTRQFLVTSAGYGSTFLTDVALEVDPVGGRVVSKSANNIAIQSEARGEDGELLPSNAAFEQFTPDPEIAAYVARYADASREAAGRKIGSISGPAPKAWQATEESALGNLIADAQLAGTKAAGAQIALMNNSGIRTDLEPAADGTVTFEEIYAVQPFGNTLVTKTFTGQQITELLEQQFDGVGILQTFSVSDGFDFSYDMTQPMGQRIRSVTLNGKPLNMAVNYRVTMNSFLAPGGDGFTIFEEGADPVIGPTDLDAMEEWIAAVSIRQLPAIGRTTDLTPKS